MARRNQPYLPLYVQDFLTDEKLIECSAESTGVYIRLLCIMHKSQDYGKILLKQKDKQNGKQNSKQNESNIYDFASKLAKQMPWDSDTILRGLTELIAEGVITIEGDTLYQKRMVKDGELSDSRAKAGKKGGKKSKQNNVASASPSAFASSFASDFAQAKIQANSEIENENEIEYENELEDSTSTMRSRYASNPDVGAVISYYLNKINAMPSNTCLEELSGYAKDLGKDVCLRAIDIAIDNNIRKWTYIRGILRDKQANGIRSLADWDSKDQPAGREKEPEKRNYDEGLEGYWDD